MGHGPAPLSGNREWFARLIARGVGNAEACRLVGVHPRTGRRWRRGRVVITRSGQRREYEPVITESKQGISSRYLSEDERVRIADLRQTGSGVREIARELGRDPGTISRELHRNGDSASGRYRPFTAQRLAGRRRARPRRGKLAGDSVLASFVADRLTMRWSPEQISRATRREFPDQPERHVVHETIYQAIYRRQLGEQGRNLPEPVLLTGRARRKPRRRPDQRRPSVLGEMAMIDQRPAEADDRTVPGHWEGDLITGAANRSAIGTLVDRASRYTLLLHLPGSHTAEEVRDALIAALGQLPSSLRRSLTWDQGREMSLHPEISEELDMPVFFCDKASPWQRPSNENTNRLLRVYFPKGTDLRIHDAAELDAVAAELNARPRKTLGWLAPAELLA